VRLAILLLTCAVPLAACRTNADAAAVEGTLRNRAARYDTALAAGGDSAAPIARWFLPRHLSEVSGLALTPDGRLLAHGDEFGRISVIDPRRGAVVSEFRLAGSRRGDFEGITLAGDDIVLVTSRGVLVTFREGPNGSSVPFSEFDTRLGALCEFEGIAFDPGPSQLVMPCKQATDKARRHEVVLYRVAVPLVPGARAEMQAIPLASSPAARWKALHPTDITRDPATGNFIIVAAPERALLELSPTGNLLRAASLDVRHVQAEGVALAEGPVLIVSDEAGKEPAAITVYRWPMAGFTQE
jgi:uncharacterized protein YjiK